MTECPYRERCWLEYVGGWQNPNPPKPHPLGIGCDYEDRCDVETCPVFARMERERREKEDTPC